jgi:hypothetical protein
MHPQDPGPVRAFKWLEETLGFGPQATRLVLLGVALFVVILVVSIAAAV